jgi:hypothetical protein
MADREERERGRVAEHCFKGGIQQQEAVQYFNSLAGRAMAIEGAAGEVRRCLFTALFVWATMGGGLLGHKGRCGLSNAGQSGERQQQEYEGYSAQHRVHRDKIQKTALLCQWSGFDVLINAGSCEFLRESLL